MPAATALDKASRILLSLYVWLLTRSSSLFFFQLRAGNWHILTARRQSDVPLTLHDAYYVPSLAASVTQQGFSFFVCFVWPEETRVWEQVVGVYYIVKVRICQVAVLGALVGEFFSLLSLSCVVLG